MNVDDTPGAEHDEAQSLTTRRTFLGGSVAIAGGVMFLGAAPAFATVTEASAAATSAGALTSSELTTLKSVLDVLFPQDDLGPGAVQMGVHTYINAALAGSYKAMLPAYKSLLPMFDKAAKATGGKSFASLSSSDKNSLLGKFEAGTPPGVRESKEAVAANFALLLEHMREGLFGDPMYGGNKDLAGWKLIGYPGVKLVWSPQEQTIGGAVQASDKTARSFGGKPYNGPPV